MANNYFMIIALCIVTINSTPVNQESTRNKRDDSYQMECCLCDDFDNHKNRHCSERRCIKDLYSSERRLIAQCEYCQYTKVYTGGHWKIRGQCSIEPLCRHDFARTIANPGCFGVGTPTEGTLCDYCCRRPNILDPYDYCINDTMSGYTKFTTFAGVSKATPMPALITTASTTRSTTKSPSTTKSIQTSSTSASMTPSLPTPISTSTSKSTTISTTLSTSSTTSSPFVCSECDSTDGTNCNDRSKSCPSGKCQNRVTFMNNGAIRHVVKSCVPDILCNANTKYNDPLCKDAPTNKTLPLSTVCSYCCDPKTKMLTNTPCNANLYAVTDSPTSVCSACTSWDGQNCHNKTELCTSGQCQNRITFKSNGDIHHIVKSCVPDILCKTNIRYNDPLCENAPMNKSLPLSTVCSYCCDPNTTVSSKHPCNTNLYTDAIKPSTGATTLSSLLTSTQSSTLSSVTSPVSSTTDSTSFLTSKSTMSPRTSTASTSTTSIYKTSSHFTSDLTTVSSSVSTESTLHVPSSHSSDLTSVQPTSSQAHIASPTAPFITPSLPSIHFTTSTSSKTSSATSNIPSSSISPLGPVCTVCSSTDGKNCDTKVQTCSTGICQTRLTYQLNGDLVYLSKSCVPEILCTTNIRINDPALCDESRANKSSHNGVVCTYCCDPSKSTNTPCNENMYPDGHGHSSVKADITTVPGAVTNNLTDTSAVTNPNSITTNTVSLTNTTITSMHAENTSFSSLSQPANSTISSSATYSNTSGPQNITSTTIKTTKTTGTGSASSSWHTKSGSTICMACLDTVETCDSLFAPVTCDEPNNYCINFMKNSDRGEITVNRTCGDINRCYREWFQGSSDNDKCQQYRDGQIITVEFECTYCCIKDNCNAKISPDRDSLYNDV